MGTSLSLNGPRAQELSVQPKPCKEIKKVLSAAPLLSKNNIKKDTHTHAAGDVFFDHNELRLLVYCESPQA